MVWLIGYVATIYAANLALQMLGVVPIGFGLMAPAGALFAGFAFTFRDVVQDQLGRRWTVAAILAGSALSAIVSPTFAVASGLAFLLSELADFAVYTPISRHHWLAAVVLSNTVGALIDSALFLMLAFGSLDFLAGQIVAKTYSTALLLPLVWWLHHR